MNSAPILPSRSQCAGSSSRWLAHVWRRLEKSCSLHSISHTLAQTNLPGCRYRCKHCLLSVARGLAFFCQGALQQVSIGLLGLQHTCRRRGLCKWLLEGHNHCPAESQGDWDAFLLKNLMELSLSKSQKPAVPVDAGEEGEGRELWVMWQPPQGYIAKEGYMLVSGKSLGQHDPVQGFLKVVATCQSLVQKNLLSSPKWGHSQPPSGLCYFDEQCWQGRFGMVKHWG